MEKKKKFIINILFYTIILAILFLSYKYLLPVLMPFIVAYILAATSIYFAKKIFKDDSKLYRFIVLIVIFAIFVILAFLIISFTVDKVGSFFISLPQLYRNYIRPVFTIIEENFNDFNENLSPEVADILHEILNSIFESLGKIVTSVSQILVNVTTNIISSAPNVLVVTITVVVSAIFFMLDFEEINAYVSRIMPLSSRKVYDDIRYFVLNNVLVLIKQYILIMAITCLELMIGLFLFKIPNFTIISILIAFLDILPILGVGTVLIPWALIAFIVGNVVRGIEITVLYVVITVIRNIIEPKLVGSSLGLHPLATLIAMILGLNFFGVIGMFGFPLLLSFFVSKKLL